MDSTLSKDRYRRLTDHFQHCVDLPPLRRQGYLATICAEDAELGRELEDLLRQHAKRFDVNGATTVPADAPPAHPSVGRKFAPLISGLARFFRWRGSRLASHDVGSYVIERCIGRGATADIYLAHHAVLKRLAAVKILKDPHPGPETARRFEREARLASQLGHPNTIQVFDYGKASDGRLYLAMEYVSGLNLSQLLALEHPLPIARVIYILKQIAGSLDEAHRMGLLHRDLKPLNVMLGCKGGTGDTVKVLDFGLASQLAGAGEDVIRSEAIVGSPAFMAPERFWAPMQMDPRSDIYSFGAVAFHLLTGRSVFEGGGPAELMYQVLTSVRPSPSRLRGERLPEPLEALVLDCLSVNPALRPPTFRSARERLRTVPLSERWGRDEAFQWWSDNREKASRFLQATV